MGNEQHIWQPVERISPNININDRMATYLANHGAKFTVTVEGLEAVAVLRGDLALCRRVPAPASVPVEVREALRVAIQLAEIASDWNLSEVEIDGEMVRTWDIRNQLKSALDAQEQGVDNE